MSQAKLKAIKLNESYSRIEGDEKELQRVFNFLKAPIPGAFFDKLVQRGIKPSHKYFCTPEIINGVRSLVLSNGLLDFLNDFGLYKHKEESDFTIEEIDEFFDFFIKTYMPFEPYDYQLRCAKELLREPKLIAKACTSCLDENTEIEVYIDDNDYEKICNLLKDNYENKNII